MCGIAGFLGDLSEKEPVIRAMTRAIAHRGPDEEAFFVEAPVAFGFRRLSVIDLVTGSQPMSFGPLTIVFNGEIYNYKELRAELKEKGHTFKTTSDTEVLLHVMSEWGREGLTRLSGMFGFALWNSETKELLLARDHLGIKPLYWGAFGDALVFGSEIKALLKHPQVTRTLNASVLNSYFQYRYVVGEETLFVGIRSLLPGHYLVVKQGEKPRISRYWTLSTTPKLEDKGEALYIKETRELLTASVKKMMQADVAVGAYLSGGLDSSIVVGLMASLHSSPKDLHTFSVSFAGDLQSERAEALEVSNKWGTTHHELELTGEQYFASLEELIRFKDAPLSVPNEVPLYHLSRALKKHITVVLSGEGADELFGGYGRIFRAAFVYERDQVKEPFQDFVLRRYNYTPDDTLGRIFAPKVVQDIGARGYTKNFFANLFKDAKGLDLEDQTLYLFQTAHLLGLLHRLDTPTMAASVEGRVPFVDKELVEFVHHVPFEYKVRWQSKESESLARENRLSVEAISEEHDTTKYLLRTAFKDLLPPAILTRKKVGFPVPLEAWFKGEGSDFVRKILTDKRTRDREIFSPACLKDGFEELPPLTRWMMLNLELFLRNYFD